MKAHPLRRLARASGTKLVCGLAIAMLVPFLAQAQTPDPFIRPPPTQAPQQNPAPNPGPNAPVPAPPTVTMDQLVRQGFEVRGMERASDRSADFVVILQRSGEIRTCLMRISRDANRQPRRDSFCF
jgi:hypothetical protein